MIIPLIVERGTVANGSKPGGITTNYGRKPYIAGQYDDQKELMTRPSRRAMENQRVSPRSQFDKPYMDDTGDYQAMEHWAPAPFPLNLPDINLQMRPTGNRSVPNVDDWVAPDNGCWLACKSPGRDCEDPIKCRIGVATGQSWIDYLKNKVKLEAFINRVPTANIDIIPSLPDPIRVYPGDTGWTKNPPGPGDLVNVTLRDKETGLITCSALLVNITCETVVCCGADDYIAPTVDTDNTAMSLVSGDSGEVYILNGCPPYTWTKTGLGTSLEYTTTDTGYNILHTTDGTCNTNYSAISSVTVTDLCGNSVTHNFQMIGDDVNAPTWKPVGNCSQPCAAGAVNVYLDAEQCSCGVCQQHYICSTTPDPPGFTCMLACNAYCAVDSSLSCGICGSNCIALGYISYWGC